MVRETGAPDHDGGSTSSDLLDRLVVDVRTFSDQLPHKHRALAGKARQWVSRFSCDADLGVAHSYIEDALRFHRTKRESLRHAIAALLQGSVIHYARAFDPATKHRAYLDIEPRLDTQARAFHAIVIDLRHESLAHFGPAGDDFNSWSQDIPAVIIEGGNWQTMIASKRALFRSNFAQDFRSHLNVVWPIVTEISERSKNRFETALSEAWESDESIEALLASSALDPAMIGGWNGPFLGRRRSGRTLEILADSDFTTSFESG